MLTPKPPNNRLIVIVFGGLVALGSLAIIATSNCGAYLDFKMSPWPNVQIRREPCPPK